MFVHHINKPFKNALTRIVIQESKLATSDEFATLPYTVHVLVLKSEN